MTQAPKTLKEITGQIRTVLAACETNTEGITQKDLKELKDTISEGLQKFIDTGNKSNEDSGDATQDLESGGPSDRAVTALSLITLLRTSQWKVVKVIFVIGLAILVSVLFTFNPLFIFLWFSVAGFIPVLAIGRDVKNNKGLFCIGLVSILVGACTFLVLFVLANVYNDGQHWWYMCAELHYGWWK